MAFCVCISIILIIIGVEFGGIWDLMMNPGLMDDNLAMMSDINAPHVFGRSGDRKQQHHLHLHRPGDEFHRRCHHGVREPDVSGQRRGWRALRQSSPGGVWRGPEHGQVPSVLSAARLPRTGGDDPAPPAEPLHLNQSWIHFCSSILISFIWFIDQFTAVVTNPAPGRLRLGPSWGLTGTSLNWAQRYHSVCFISTFSALI